MAEQTISDSLVNDTKTWLSDDGIAFFRDVKEKHGKINACWDEGGIPHPVHFREGMQIRNFMRGTEHCKSWDAHDFDDNWIPLIEECIK